MNISKGLGAAALFAVFVAGCSGAMPEPTSKETTGVAQQAAKTCVQNVLCIQGDHWDSTLCMCVPNTCISADDGPCGGFTSNPCTCGDGLVCVPNPIPDIPGTCEVDRCCPIGWDMYQCNEENGSKGYNCHNPALGCPSSLACGGGCDIEVTHRCQAVCDPIVCPAGETWDPTRCACIQPCSTAADCTGPLPGVCKICANGTTGCAHFACLDNACEVVYCE
jgi:hypothetical protein